MAPSRPVVPLHRDACEPLLPTTARRAALLRQLPAVAQAAHCRFPAERERVVHWVHVAHTVKPDEFVHRVEAKLEHMLASVKPGQHLQPPLDRKLALQVIHKVGDTGLGGWRPGVRRVHCQAAGSNGGREVGYKLTRVYQVAEGERVQSCTWMPAMEAMEAWQRVRARGTSKWSGVSVSREPQQASSTSNAQTQRHWECACQQGSNDDIETH